MRDVQVEFLGDAHGGSHVDPRAGRRDVLDDTVELGRTIVEFDHGFEKGTGAIARATVGHQRGPEVPTLTGRGLKIPYGKSQSGHKKAGARGIAPAISPEEGKSDEAGSRGRLSGKRSLSKAVPGFCEIFPCPSPGAARRGSRPRNMIAILISGECRVGCA